MAGLSSSTTTVELSCGGAPFRPSIRHQRIFPPRHRYDPEKKTQTHAKVILVYNLPTNEQMKYLTKFATVGHAKRG